MSLRSHGKDQIWEHSRPETVHVACRDRAPELWFPGQSDMLQSYDAAVTGIQSPSDDRSIEGGLHVDTHTKVPIHPVRQLIEQKHVQEQRCMWGRYFAVLLTFQKCLDFLKVVLPLRRLDGVTSCPNLPVVNILHSHPVPPGGTDYFSHLTAQETECGVPGMQDSWY